MVQALSDTIHVDATDPALAVVVWILTNIVKRLAGQKLASEWLPAIAFAGAMLLRFMMNGGAMAMEDVPRALAAAGVASLVHGQVSSTTKKVKANKAKKAAKHADLDKTDPAA